MNPLLDRKCLNTALRLLGRRDHSRRELARKLTQRGFEASQIVLVIAECERLNYLDDKKFCRLYTMQLRRKGYGVLRIEQMLKQKGLPLEYVKDCLDRHCGNNEQLNDCRKALAKKLKIDSRSQHIHEHKLRLYRFLFNRGFASSTVREVLTDIIG